MTLTLTLTEAAITQRCLRHNGCCSGKVTVLVARLRRAGGSDLTPTQALSPPLTLTLALAPTVALALALALTRALTLPPTPPGVQVGVTYSCPSTLMPRSARVQRARC